MFQRRMNLDLLVQGFALLFGGGLCEGYHFARCGALGCKVDGFVDAVRLSLGCKRDKTSFEYARRESASAYLFYKGKTWTIARRIGVSSIKMLDPDLRLSEIRASLTAIRVPGTLPDRSFIFQV